MHPYLLYCIESPLASAGILLILWLILWFTSRNHRIDYRGATLENGDLEHHAHALKKRQSPELAPPQAERQL